MTPTPPTQLERAVPPARLLLCLGPCHGEFYYPLAEGDMATCPNDRTHPVAIYSRPKIFEGENG